MKNKKFVQKRTPPTTLSLQSTDDKSQDTITIILVFILMGSLFYLLEEPLHTFLSGYVSLTYAPSHIILKSEYTLGEQVSKFYLFTIVLLSVFSYRSLQEPAKIKLSISLLLLGLAMYMSESNMIVEKAQPVFGLLGVAFTGFFLLRVRYWSSLILLLAGFMMIACGSLTDLTQENKSIQSLVPSFIYYFLDITSEERFDVMGISLIWVSSMLCFREPLRHFVEKNTKASVLMLLSSGMLTIGNGFLHYQYRPENTLYLIALVMTLVGFLGLVFANKSIDKDHPRLMLVTEDLFYIFIFIFFVVLPSVHGRARSSTALILWLPWMIFMARYLWRCHSTHQGRVG